MRAYEYNIETPINVNDYFVMDKWDSIGTAYATTKCQYQSIVDYVTNLTLDSLYGINVSPIQTVAYKKFIANSGSNLFNIITTTTTQKLEVAQLKYDPLMVNNKAIIPIEAKLRIFVNGVSHPYCGIHEYKLQGYTKFGQVILNTTTVKTNAYQSTYVDGTSTYTWEGSFGALTFNNFNGGLAYNTLGGVYYPYSLAVNIGVNNSLRIKKTTETSPGIFSITFEAVHCTITAVLEYTVIDKLNI